MNRNYKVIWNASLNCFMAVAEYAKARGKSSKSSVSSNATINTTSNLSSTSAFKLTAIGLGLFAAELTMSPQVFAATSADGAVATGVTNCAPSASAGKYNSVAVGCGSIADLSTDPAVTFYQRGNPENLGIDTSTAFNSTAIGTGAKATEAGTSLGMNASSRNLGIALGIQAKSDNVAAVAIGPAALATGNTSLALGRQSAATADFAQAIGNVSSATAKGSLAMGHSARAEGYRSIAIGSADIDGANATGTQSGVVYQTNQQTVAKGKDSMALGAGANSWGENALAIGAGSKATATNAIAIGKNSEVAGDNTVSVGWNSGIGSTQSEGVSVGNRSGQNVLSNGNVALGLDAGSNIGSTPRATVTTGVAAYRPYTILGQNTGIGAAAGKEVYGDSNSALGERAGRNVDGHANTAIGAFSGNAVVGSANVAMGPTSGYTVTGDRNTAVGNFSGSHVVGKANSAFGNGAGSNVTGEYNLALGATAGAGITNNLSIAIGNNAGNIAKGNVGESSISVGTNSSAQGLNSMAIGRGSVSAGNNAIGIGVQSIASATGAIAVGDRAEASGENAIAIGKGSLATGSQAIGVGSRAGNGGAAYGDNADAGGTIISATPTVIKGTAIGNGSIVNVDNGVALGSKSVANRAATGSGVVFTTSTASPGDISAINNTRSTVLGAVSVGNDTYGNRQIVNVAAGSLDSDAVNVAQLKGVSNAIAANKTKYYSVNSTGGTNDDNLGASGQNAMAMGRNSVASGSQAISIGSGASGQKTTASGEQSIAIGANTVSTGASSIAIGGDDLDAASKANLIGAASGSVNGGSVNTTFKAYTGRDLVETPPYQVNTESGGAASIAMGAKALSQGALSTAIGVQSSTTGVASSALGMGSSAMKEGSVALGAGSVANVAGGMVGYVPVGATNSAAITATQSGARFGAVSVGTGDKGGNRQIVNLAAGTNDSDAVNVAQLKGGVSSVVDLGLNFTGDNIATTVNRKLGEKLIVKGGESDATKLASGNNIGVEATSPDTLSVKLAKDLTGLTSVTTGNTVMNTSGISFTGSTVKLSGTGLNNGGNQITNVASGGTTLTNAANIGDVNSAAAANKTKYYSVNSTGGTNDDNLGASGQNAMAMGRNSVASGSQAISIGSGASGQKTTASGEQSIAIGANTVSTGASSIAIGGDDLDAASKANLIGAASGSVNGGSVNTTFKAYTGRDLVETPPYQVNTESGGAASIAMGAKALSQGALSTAIGVQSSTTGVASSALGMGSSAMKEGSVALGAGSVANVAGGMVGYVPVGATNSAAITATQSGARFGAVSVGTGDKGGNRQIVNLAAGTNDSDAVNVAQLKGGVSSVVDLGLNFTGDNIATTVNRKLGEKLIVKGGESDATKLASGNNIGVVASSPDTLTVKLAKDLTGLTSVTTGNTVMNTSGITLTGGINQTVTLSNSGLNNGGNQITNVKAGTEDMDAVNVGQLNLTNTAIDKGLNFGGDSGTDVNRKLGQKLIVKGGDTINADPATKNISVTANGDDTLTVRLAKDINLGETGSVTTGNTQVNNAGITLYRGDNGQVVLTNNGLNNGGNQITNVLSGGETLTNAANIGDVKGAVSDIATKGLDFAGNDGINIHKDLGQKLEIVGALDASKTASAKNIRTVANNGKLEVQLADALDVTSVTTGNAFMNNNGFTFVGNEPGRTVILSSSGLDNGGNIIRNVGTGTLNSDAVNVGQLREVTIALDQGWGITAQGDIATMVKQGGSVDMNSRDGNIKVSRTLISNAAALDSGTGLRAAAIPAGANDLSFDLNPDLTVDSLTTGDTTINSNGLTIVGGPSVTKSGIDAADKKITNVRNGSVSASSQDAINGSQLYAQGSGISSIIGGNTVYNPVDGTFTNSNIGGTGEGSIDGAIGSIRQGTIEINENVQVNTTNIETNTINIVTNTRNIVTNTTNIATNTTNIKSNTDKLDAGLNFGADSGANINKPIGDESVLIFKGGNNITTTSAGSSIKFDLNGNINVDSVTTGDTTVSSSGVTIAGGPSITKTGIYAGNGETAPSMTAAGINAAGTKITNVADGMQPRDAVNFGQLDAVSRGLGNSINELGYRVDEVEDDANAGISAAMAMSSLPQAYIIGKSMIGGGIATYNGESAVAIGFSKLSTDGRWVMKLNGTADTQGNVGAAIGAGFHFD